MASGRMVHVGVLIAVFATPFPSSAKLAGPDTSAIAVPDSILASPTVNWRLSDLSSTIRGRVHLTANRVPPFPQEDPRLMDSRKWPDVTVIGGVRCSLRVQTGEYDAIWFVRSLDEVKPGAGYSLFYTSTPNDFWKSRRGPTYCWRGNGTLLERYWKDGDSTRYVSREYMYYPSGELFRFISRSDGYDLRTESRRWFEAFEESFARSGTLIGFGYGSGGGRAKGVSVGFWMGEDVKGYGEYRNRMIQAQLKALR